MRVLVCGGRDYDDAKHLDSVLWRHWPYDLLIEGGARGADRLAATWARFNDVPVRTFPADWRTYGKRAGHIRNGDMLFIGKPDLVIAFPGGRGTADMVAQARAAGVRVVEA